MALKKYTQAESVKVETPETHKRIEAGLHKLGKTKLEDCTDAEKNAIYYDRIK